MKRSATLSVLSVCAIATALFAQGVRKEDKSFVGKWVAAKKDGSLPKLEITAEGDRLKIQAWGKCHPDDCDWGVVPLHRLGDSVSAHELPYGFATWDAKFKATHMTLRLEKGELVAETYDIFSDDSGRSNYRSVVRFKRAPKD